MSTNEITKREINVRPHGHNQIEGYVVEVLLHHGEDGDHGVVMHGSEKIGQYAFIRLDYAMETSDHVEGSISLDTDAVPVAYIGRTLGKNYYQSHSLDDIDDSLRDDVIRELSFDNLQIITNVDGGWEHWDGRPEWSETYIDVTDAELYG